MAKRNAILAAIFLAATTSTVSAQGKEFATTREQFIKDLKRDGGSNRVLKITPMIGGSEKDGAPDQGVKAVPPSADDSAGGMGFPANPEKPMQNPTANSMVEFAFGSDELTNSARRLLNELGAALRSNELAGDKYSIRGHTDSVGSEDYNLNLSARRAEAVRDYLISHFDVPAGQLEAIGLGKRQPYDARNPVAGINRRVEIVNLGDQ